MIAMAGCGPLRAQTVAGCGTTAIPKADASNRDRLSIQAECFGKAKAVAEAAETTRRERIAALPTPGHGDTTPPTPTGYDRKIPAAIASNFKVSDWIERSPGGLLPATAAPDPIGAFRFICQPAHLSYDDPVVFPGQPGKSHLHQWFGNTLGNASSTYETLRRTGDSTCQNILNRSAYWIPAMLNGKGQVARPDYVSIYYKRLPSSSPLCAVWAQRCASLPRGLRYIFGFDMMTMKGVAPDLAYLNCDGPGARPGHYADLLKVAPNCPVGAHVGVVLVAPDCWDGTNLDSPDHRSHVAYMQRDPHTGQSSCPKTHPVLLPAFTLGAWYTVLPGESVAEWSLSSDEMTMPDGSGHKMTPGSTAHGDWFGAWDDATLETAMRNCIDKLLSCSNGDLGNGTVMKRWPGYGYVASPQRVPIPARPG